MPRGYRTEITEETIQTIKTLSEQGVHRKDISIQLKVPYAKVYQILTPRKEKTVITPALLAELENDLKQENFKAVAKKYNRTAGEMRCLLLALNWKVPDNWKEVDYTEYKDKIQELLDRGMNFKDIGEVIDIPKNKVYYICRKLNLKKLTTQVENKSNDSLGLQTYNSLLRMSADSIKEKLKKQYEKQEAKQQQ